MFHEYLDVLCNKNVVFYLIYDILVVFALAHIKTFYLVLLSMKSVAPGVLLSML